jgi:hypothetical protein
MLNIYEWFVYYIQTVMYYMIFIAFALKWATYLIVAANIIYPLFGGQPVQKEEVCQLHI